MKILITGCAGFIGYHLCKSLISNKNNIVYGIDNLNNYYDVNLKKKRLANLKKYKNFIFYKKDIKKYKVIEKIYLKNKFKYVVHLAAQAGVRYSIKNPKLYLKNNIDGFFNILDLSKNSKVKHFLFASSSSVYGNNKSFPLSEKLNTDKPLSFYSSTKKSNEVMAHSYSNIYKMPCTALRFFTVYGPYGRPDMSLFKFTDLIQTSKKIELYNSGDHERDFTYIDDCINILVKIIKKPVKRKIPFNIINVGSGKPKKLLYFLSLIEKKLNKKAKIIYRSLQKGDVHKTHASTRRLRKFINIRKSTPLEKGIINFINWYSKFKKIK